MTSWSCRFTETSDGASGTRRCRIPSKWLIGRRSMRVWRRTKRSSWRPGTCCSSRAASPTPPLCPAGCSVHLTIGLSSQTGIDFLDHLRKEAAKDPLLRMDLPRHSSDEQSDAHEAALKHRLHQLIDAASMSQFLREGDLSRLPALQTAVAGALPQMDDVLRLTLAPAHSAPGCRAERRAAARHDRRRGATPLPGVDRRPAMAFRSRSRNFACASRRIVTASWTGLDRGRDP